MSTPDTRYYDSAASHQLSYSPKPGETLSKNAGRRDAFWRCGFPIAAPPPAYVRANGRGTVPRHRGIAGGRIAGGTTPRSPRPEQLHSSLALGLVSGFEKLSPKEKNGMQHWNVVVIDAGAAGGGRCVHACGRSRVARRCSSKRTKRPGVKIRSRVEPLESDPPAMARGIVGPSHAAMSATAALRRSGPRELCRTCRPRYGSPNLNRPERFFPSATKRPTCWRHCS